MIDARFNSVDTIIEQLYVKFHTLNTKVDNFIDEFNSQLQCLDTKMIDAVENIDGKLTTLNAKVDNLEDNFDNRFSILDSKIETKFDSLDVKFSEKLESITLKLDTLQTQVQAVYHKIDDVEIKLTVRIDNLDYKIVTLDSKVCNIDMTVANLAIEVAENHTFLSNRIDSVNNILINFTIQQTQCNDDTDNKLLDIDKYFQDNVQHITTIEKAVYSTAEKFQDHLKMADASKAEIRDKINKSASESSEQLDQKSDTFSQPLRSEMKKLSDRLNIIQQRCMKQPWIGHRVRFLHRTVIRLLMVVLLSWGLPIFSTTILEVTRLNHLLFTITLMFFLHM